MSIDDVTGPFGAPVPESVEAELRANELNLFDATAVAVSSVAPAYSLASTVTAVFVIVGIGLRSPAVIILSFIPVLFVAMSYFHLNRRNPNCGASYSWLSQVVHPTVGWYNGWVQVATSVLFCTTAPLLAGTYTLQFLHSAFHAFSNHTIHSAGPIGIVSALWLILVTFICVYGIRWTTNAQWVMVIIEYVCVIGFSLGGIIKVAVSHPHFSRSFNASWLDPFHLHGWSAIAQGLALGVFFFWGWDTALNLNEETKDASKTPGRAGIIAMWLLLVVFTMNIVAIQMLLSPAQIANQGSAVLFFFGQQFAGKWASYVMIFAVLSSTVATTQTTLLPAARISYAMSRDKVFPALFGTIHPKFKTPALGTVVLAMISLFGILLSTLSTSANTFFQNLVLNIGVLVAFYYGITGLACAWAFRRTLGKGTWKNLTMVVAPFIGGAVLIFVCYQVIKSAGMSAIWDDVILLMGLPLVILVRQRTIDKEPFFSQPQIAYDTID
jgi:amino acid transporter